MDKFESLREPMDMPDPHFPIKLHQISFDQQDQVIFPHHWHEQLEFLYFVAGEATIECGSTTIAASKGDLIVVNSNELHYGISRSTNLAYYALIADISLLNSKSIDAAETKFITLISQNRILLRNLIANDNKVTDCMLTIINEIKTREFGFELAIKSELYRLLTLLLRGHVATVLSKEEYTERLKNVERFSPIFQHIDERYMDDLSIEFLSEKTGLSRFHFSRLFKELTGRTVTEYVTATRLNKADYLLRHSSLSISDIAAATGFNDIYYFSRTFKKHKKISPSTLRKE